MLPDLVPEDWIGRAGGRAWEPRLCRRVSSALLCAYSALFRPTRRLSAAIQKTKSQFAPAAIVVALWFALFAIPFFLFTPDRTHTGLSAGAAVRAGLGLRFGGYRTCLKASNIIRFLIARMLYADRLTTLFTFGGIYAAGTFGMSFSEIIIFGIALNVTAGAGAFAFAWVDDKLGSKTTIQISLTGLIVCGAAVLSVKSVTWFWIAALAVGIFIGPFNRVAAR